MYKKLVTIALAVLLAVAAFVQIGGHVGSRDMSGDTHARAVEMAE